MTTRRAACACGQLAVTCVGEPLRVSMCHCLDCQRRTGAPFGQQARFSAEAVTTEGEASIYERRGDEGGLGRMRFCPRCGTTVWWTLDVLPGMIAVAVGAFADPTFPRPMVSVYESRRHPWTRETDPADLEKW